MDQGSRLLGSVVKAANSTAPLVANVSDPVAEGDSPFQYKIIQIVQETVEQIPLATGFLSAYAEVNAEQTQKVS